MENIQTISSKNQAAKSKQPVYSFKKGLSNYVKNKYLVVLMIPAVIYYILFHYVPIYGVQIAFKDYLFKDGIWGSPWVGLENFKLLFSTGSFREVFLNTLTISFYKLLAGFPSPIIFALLLNEIRSVKFKKITQSISYLPHFISWVVLAGIFIQFLSPSTGPINIVLKAVGYDPIYFLADPKWFRTVLVTTSVWKEVGWGSVIYIAALSGINPELYEAAIVDGAGRLKQAWYITLPSLAPVITIMLIFAVGGIINDDFDQIFNMYNTRVLRVADVISTYTYRMGLVDMQYSFSAAVGLFKNVIAFVLIIITNTISKRINEHGIW